MSIQLTPRNQPLLLYAVVDAPQIFVLESRGQGGIFDYLIQVLE